MVKIQLNSKKGVLYTIVDDDDYVWLKNFHWWSRGGYVECSDRKRLQMHRLIVNCPKGYVVDHINGNGLDNRKCNLRICRPFQNSKNRRKNKNNISGYRGVSWSKNSKRWVVQVQVDNRRVNAGYFKKKRHAAMVYDIWAKESYGEYANLNFKSV